MGELDLSRKAIREAERIGDYNSKLWVQFELKEDVTTGHDLNNIEYLVEHYLLEMKQKGCSSETLKAYQAVYCSINPNYLPELDKDAPTEI